jgi:hypothetical protein
VQESIKFHDFAISAPASDVTDRAGLHEELGPINGQGDFNLFVIAFGSAHSGAPSSSILSVT